MNYTIFDFIGNVGLILLLGTYLLLQVGKISSETLKYSVLNAFAASLIGISLLVNFNLSAFLVEAFWLMISLYGVFRYVRGRKSVIKSS